MSEDSSIFYQKDSPKGYVISLMALEVFALRSSLAETDEALADCLERVIKEYCGVTSPSEKDLKFFVDKMQAMQEKAEENKGSGTSLGKTFGSSYMQFLSDLPVDRVIMRMVNYDYAKAEFLYKGIDRDECMKLVDSYVAGCVEMNLVMMEASMYGFGGSYEEDKPKKKGIDIASAEGEAQLKSLGF